MIRPYRAKGGTPYRQPALDIETAPDGRLLAIGFAWQPTGAEVEYITFTTWADWLAWYRRRYLSVGKSDRKRLRNIFAHNGGGFDWLHLFRYLIESGYVVALKSFQSGSALVGLDIKLRIAKERFTLRLRDSMRLMPKSLAALCETFALDYQKIDLGDELPHETLKRDPELFWQYLRMDTLALQEVVYRFWSLIVSSVGPIDQLPMTLPSLAMRLWRLTLRGKPMMTPRHARACALEHEAYKGGRTECLATGRFDVRIYDVNSEYPAAMRDGVFPVSYVGGWTDHYSGKHGIYRLSFKQTNRERLPVLSVLNESTHSYDYVYEGTGVYTQPEIEKMLTIGGEITAYHEGYEYFHVGNPFRRFIDHWYTIREQTDDDGLKYICKILMNSLYGKFGQEQSGWSFQVWNAEQYAQAMADEKEFKDYGDVVSVKEARRNETSFFGLAAYITSQARIMLYDYATAAQDAGNRVVYMDTDSVHASGGAPLPTSTGLGALKLEYAGKAAYAGRKLYIKLDTWEIDKDGRKTWDVKAKGIGKKARATITPDTFDAMVSQGLSFELSFTAFPTPLEVLSGRAPPAVLVTRTRTIRRTGPLTIHSPPG